jgi:hypothetical protein
MSNFSRKQKRNKKLKDTYEEYRLDLNFTVGQIVVEVVKYNPKFYKNGNEFINSYGLLLTDYKSFLEKIGKQIRFIEFLNDSVDNNPYLSDTIQNLDFEVRNDHILFKYNNENMDYINMGEFFIDNYRVNVCHSYTFIEDLLSNNKYMYYGD